MPESSQIRHLVRRLMYRDIQERQPSSPKMLRPSNGGSHTSTGQAASAKKAFSATWGTAALFLLSQISVCIINLKVN